jgi:LuxR family maltose regulon positive regulatory protein
MPTPILATKFFIPPTQSKVVLRERLIERLNDGLRRKLILVSAPAGFGKTTLVSEWLAGCEYLTAWLSLDIADNDPNRFLAYVVAALQSVAKNIGDGMLSAPRSSMPPPAESILTVLINEISTLSDNIILVLDDYHVIDAASVDHVLTFLLENLPPQLHLVIATREDPQLPLARFRARNQMTELRAADLRFNTAEAAAFLNPVMGFDLPAADIAALVDRTEGWIAGLQLAAISMRGHQDASGFIQSFTGSHRYVMDYLVEEVLNQLPGNVQAFLLRTSILDRLCGSLCDAVLLDLAVSGQHVLEYIERANLFLVPLDNERRWFRYHHLFAELLRQRLHDGPEDVTVFHVRASDWYAAHDLELAAFRHATAANDVERAELLIEGNGVPLQFRGAGTPVLRWLDSLPRAVLDARPSLWVTYASTVLFDGQHTAVEEKLQAAEAAMQQTEPDNRIADLLGRIASMRATQGIIHGDVDSILVQSRRALTYLHPDNLLFRVATTYTLGYAHQLQGDRAEASRAFADVIAAGKSLGASIYTITATLGLAQVQEADINLRLASKTYRRVLELAGDPPQPIACVAHLGLGRIAYQWNDLEAAQEHGQQCQNLTRQMESVTTFASCAVLLAHLRLAQGDVSGAVALLAEAEAFVHQHDFMFQMPEVAAAQVLTLLCQDQLAAAARLAEDHDLPLSQARVSLARGDAATALEILAPLREQAEAKNWQDERLKVIVLQSLAHQAYGEQETAVSLLSEALTLAEPGGLIRVFLDEGLPMAHLLTEAVARGIRSGSAESLLAAFAEANPTRVVAALPLSPLLDPLSERELEVLHLIAQGLSNREIGERLFLALSTVKGHNRMIFDKLQVQRRTEAVARARELSLLA